MDSKFGFLALLLGVAQGAPSFPVALTGTNFTLVGTYAGVGRSGEYVESDYNVTFNSKVPIDAERDCDAVFAGLGGGKLVEFGEVGEMDAVNKWLDQYGAGLLYWTGGVYDVKDGYYWKDSNEDMAVPVIQHIMITTPPRKVDQLVFSHDSARRFHMELRPNSNPEAYICEVKRPESGRKSSNPSPTPGPSPPTPDLSPTPDNSPSPPTPDNSPSSPTPDNSPTEDYWPSSTPDHSQTPDDSRSPIPQAMSLTGGRRRMHG
ncbi:uncharacterized protein LOC110860250 [Folsomia candida]|uniref:Cell surface glycoprotein 1 n=1 Tax=Folsomia candida TaxID=158441 RepID=A0A226D7J2_FOLCA|nr:uncharacterized protein LOC110860250 [Folsomia candida]OXA41189.1 Cell surface glycoprotein 1 [Folsomia candida]